DAAPPGQGSGRPGLKPGLRPTLELMRAAGRPAARSIRGMAAPRLRVRRPLFLSVDRTAISERGRGANPAPTVETRAPPRSDMSTMSTHRNIEAIVDRQATKAASARARTGSADLPWTIWCLTDTTSTSRGAAVAREIAPGRVSLTDRQRAAPERSRS